MNTNYKARKAEIMRDANIIKKAAKISRGDAMKKAYLVASLTAILSTGAVADITFLKADGTIREMKALPASVGEHLITGTGKNHTPSANMLVVDFDLKQFRCFKKASLISVRKAA